MRLNKVNVKRTLKNNNFKFLPPPRERLLLYHSLSVPKRKLFDVTPDSKTVSIFALKVNAFCRVNEPNSASERTLVATSFSSRWTLSGSNNVQDNNVFLLLGNQIPTD